MDAAEVAAFLRHPATERQIWALRQNHALAALMFLYREVLVFNVPWFDGACAGEASETIAKRAYSERSRAGT